MTVDGIRVNEDDVARIVRELRDPEGPDIVSIEEIATDALAHWPNRTTDHVIITRRQRAHYLEEHPEMAEFEEALVRTLLDPEPVHVATGPGDTAALFGRRDSAQDIVVIDAVSSHWRTRSSLHDNNARRGSGARRTDDEWCGESEVTPWRDCHPRMTLPLRVDPDRRRQIISTSKGHSPRLFYQYRQKQR